MHCDRHKNFFERNADAVRACVPQLRGCRTGPMDDPSVLDGMMALLVTENPLDE